MMERHDEDAVDVYALQARVRNLSDASADTKTKLAEYKIEIERSKADISELRTSSVNHYQFDGAIDLLKQSLETLSEAVEEIRKGVWWGVKLILGFVITGLLVLLFQQGRLG